MADDDDDDFEDLLGPDPEKPLPLAGGISELKLTPGRARQRRSRSLLLRPRKLSNERMIRVLTAITEFPVSGDACMRAGISVSTLKYWMQGSAEGQPGDGYDVVLDPDEPENTVRFHEAWADAMEIGLSRVERAAMQMATGYYEVGVYQGKVVYQHDRELVEIIGYECQQTYLLDPATGAPVPEMILKQDPDMIRFILKSRMSEVYGNKQQIDVNYTGGVLAVPERAVTAQALITDQSYKADAVDVEFEEVGEE